MSMTFPLLATRVLRAAAAVALSAGLLAACGGSTSQVDAFVPDRVLAFGDELNYLTSDGHKYTVNALDATTKALDCVAAPLWVQYLATTHYGRVFSQCQGTGTSPSVTAVNMAGVNARTADLVSSLDNYMAGTGFASNDLVTVLVGMHDVLDEYALYDGTNLADLEAELATRGELLATQIKRIVGTGARVIISTVTDMGLTPYAIAEKANKGDDRPTVLTALTEAFNKNMRLGLTDLDGSQAGLLIADDLTRAMVRVPTYYGLSDVVTAICTTASPNCTTDTVVTAASGSTAAYLWADDIHPGATFHLQLGMQAASRVASLPF
jgi:outer membrane lipase/esterase